MAATPATKRRLPPKEAVRTSRDEAARRIALLLEQHMDSLGLSERQKSKTVSRFSKAVAQDLGARPKRPK
jgi:hypothetical protein